MPRQGKGHERGAGRLLWLCAKVISVETARPLQKKAFK